MQQKIMSVFYGNDRLPYKDAQRTVHYPIANGDLFCGANNTTQIRFYVDQIGGTSNVQWVATSKLPNGQIGNKVLSSPKYDEELGEHYLELDLSSYYTSIKGDVYIALNGYQGGVNIEEDEDTGIWSISGTPTIQATGSIKLGINYAPQTIPGTHFGVSDLQQILGALSGKANISDTIIVVDNESGDFSGYDEGQLIYSKYSKEYFVVNSGGTLSGFDIGFERAITLTGTETISSIVLPPVLLQNWGIGRYNDTLLFVKVALLTSPSAHIEYTIYQLSNTGSIKCWYNNNSNGTETIASIVSSTPTYEFATKEYLSGYVEKTQTIAGINLENDISAESLISALDIYPVMADDITKENEIFETYQRLEVLEGMTDTPNQYNNEVIVMSQHQCTSNGYLTCCVKPKTSGKIKVVICSRDANHYYTILKVGEYSVVGGQWNTVNTGMTISGGQYFGIVYSANMALWFSSTSLPQTPDYGVHFKDQSYSGAVVGLTITNLVGTYYQFLQDYAVSKRKTLTENGLVNDNYGKRSISTDKIQLGRNIYQDFKFLNEIASIYNSGSWSTYNNAVFTLRSTPVNRTCNAVIKAYSRATGSIHVSVGTLENSVFTIRKTVDAAIVAGLNTIEIDVQNGENIAVSYSSNTAFYFTGTSNADGYYWKDYSSSNAGDTITITGGLSATLKFSWDYELTSAENGVAEENINEKAITYEKLSDEVRALMNFGHYYQRRCNISQILRNPTSTIKIKLIGDSITYGVGATDRNTTSWAGLMKTYFESMFNCTVTNSGASGQDSTWVVNNLATLISDNDDIVICMIGTNNRATAHDLYADMITISQYCEDRGIKFIPMCSIPANNTDETENTPRAFHMDKVNHILTAFAYDYQYELIDLYTEFYRFCNFDDTTLSSYLTDGLHPNDNGYYIMFRLICDKLGCSPKISGATW